MTTLQTRRKIYNKPVSNPAYRRQKNFEAVHSVTNDLLNTLLGILPYILAICLGISFRTVIMTCKGYEYALNGMDLLNAVLCAMIVFTIKFISKNKK